jgi:hypothetical protein
VRLQNVQTMEAFQQGQQIRLNSTTARETQMSWSLYLDDERNPKTDRNWVIVRNIDAARDLVLSRGCPSYISFDHDLGSPFEYHTGYAFAKWLVDAELDGKIVIPRDFQFNVHSANSVGRDNIEGLLRGYLKNRLS